MRRVVRCFLADFLTSSDNYIEYHHIEKFLNDSDEAHLTALIKILPHLQTVKNHLNNEPSMRSHSKDISSSSLTAGKDMSKKIFLLRKMLGCIVDKLLLIE